MDEEQKQERSTADYASYKAEGKKPGRADRKYDPDKDRDWGKLLKPLVILLVLAALGAALYWLFLKSDPAKDDVANNPNNVTTPAESNIISTTMEHHTSQELALEFDYPSDWEVQETQGKLTATSPTLKLTDQNGRKVDGQVVMTIRNKQQPPTEFDAGPAIAARESEKIAYKNPSQGQRGNTYISWLRYAGSTGTEQDYDGVYITGDNGYQKGQNAPKTDFAAVDPLVSITYLKDGKSITVADNMWDDPDFSGPLKAMLQSLTIN